MTNKFWQGNLNLVYGKHQGQTKVTHSLLQAPLKVQRPFYPEGNNICHHILLHTAGGIVGGDRLNQRLILQNDAQVVFTTAAAGKVYRSNGEVAKQDISISVHQDACLEWLPQETIIFNGAVYHQNIKVDIAPGGSWLGWEINRFGRTARGEKFLQGEWRSHTEIWQQGQPLWIDRQYLQGSEESFSSPNGLAQQPIVASLVWLGKPVPIEILEKAQQLYYDSSFLGEAGVTYTQGQGLLCRYRGASTMEVKSWFMAVWELLRLSLLERQAFKLRVWQ